MSIIKFAYAHGKFHQNKLIDTLSSNQLSSNIRNVILSCIQSILENLDLIVREPIASQLANSDANASFYTNCLFTTQVCTKLVQFRYGIYGS